MSLSERQKQILIGLLLGDGHLELNGKNTRLKIDHGEFQKDYVLWKYQELQTLASANPIQVDVLDRRNGRTYRHFRFATRTISELNEYRQVFYDGGGKTIPKHIDKLMTKPLTLAVWYMDDGHRRTDCRAVRLNTQSYALEEQLLLQSCLAKNFDIRVRIHKVTRGMHVLYVPSDEAERFCDVIRPHVIASMKHKLL